MNEEYMKQLWRKNAKEKEKALDAKQSQLQQAFEFAEEAKQKKEQLSDLEKQLLLATEECTSLRTQVKCLNKQLQEIEDKYKGNFEIQMRYSNASEASLQRTAEKLIQTEKILQEVRLKLGNVINNVPRTSDLDEMKETENEFSFVPLDLEILLDSYRELKNIQKRYDDLLEERDYILSHLGYNSSEQPPSLINAYKQFAVKNEENILTLRHQVEQYGQMLEDQKAVSESTNKNEEEAKKRVTNGTAVWQAAIMSIMRKQLHEVKHQNRMKDAKIEYLEKEFQKVKTHKASLSREPPSERIHSEGPSLANGSISENSEKFNDVQSETWTNSTVRSLPTGAPLPPLRNMAGFPSNSGSPTLYRKTGHHHYPHHHHSPKPSYKAPSSVPRENLPEGLTTSPVRFDQKRYGSRIGYVLGDLKNMHGKYRADKSHQQTSPRV